MIQTQESKALRYLAQKQHERWEVRIELVQRWTWILAMAGMWVALWF